MTTCLIFSSIMAVGSHATDNGNIMQQNQKENYRAVDNIHECHQQPMIMDPVIV